MDPAYPDDVSASEIGDYVYCPRSHWYSTHPPPGGPTADGVRRSAAGARRHARELRAIERRAERGSAYWVVLLLGGLGVAGGILWWIR